MNGKNETGAKMNEKVMAEMVNRISLTAIGNLIEISTPQIEAYYDEIIERSFGETEGG